MMRSQNIPLYFNIKIKIFILNKLQIYLNLGNLHLRRLLYNIVYIINI